MLCGDDIVSQFMLSPDLKNSATASSLLSLETPCLLLDIERLERNCSAMRERCHALGVALRPHLKTAKSLDVARLATGGRAGAITVSTLKEAEHFAHGGHKDILLAAGIVPAKFAHATRIQRETGCDLILVTDSIEVVHEAARFAAEQQVTLSFLIEIDCGEHRGGLPPRDPAIVGIAKAIAAVSGLRLRGVMTHGGHSYGTDDPQQVKIIAAAERDAVVAAAIAIRAAGLPCDIVSVGSTPGAMYAESLNGVTEMRPGVYMFMDLMMVGRNVCRQEDIVVSVLASVIGHNRAGGGILLDAGALALSKDIGAHQFLPDAGYGYVCDARSFERLGRLAVDIVYQEHGVVKVDDEPWFDRLPVGSLVRVLPNHTCITCAAYDVYEVVRGDAVVGRWPRVNGW
jgi:D-serine deaminase-like pyridoxal phosphate-dependent protein